MVRRLVAEDLDKIVANFAEDAVVITPKGVGTATRVSVRASPGRSPISRRLTGK